MRSIRARLLGVELIWLFLIVFLFSHVVAQSVDSADPLPESFSIISPLAGEVVSDEVVFFLKVDDSFLDGKASISLSSSPDNELLSLNAENGWMAELDVSALENGIHSLNVSLCSFTCETKTVDVVVEKTVNDISALPNAEVEGDGEISDDKLVSLFPSNLGGAFVLVSEENFEQTFSSSGDAWLVERGKYSAKLIFFDFPFSQWNVDSVDVQSDATLLSLHELSITSSIPFDGVDRTPAHLFRVAMGVPFSSSSFSLPDSVSNEVVICDSFDDALNACSGEWVEITPDAGAFDLPFSSSPFALAILSPPPIPVSHSISFSNLPGVFHLFSVEKSKEGPFSSDALSIREGTYTVNGSWEDIPLVNVQLTDVLLNESGTIFTFETLPLDDGSVLLSYAIPYVFSFSSFRLSSPFNTVFACDDSSLSACDSPVALDSFSFPSSSGKLLVVREAVQPPVLDENTMVSVPSELEESIAWLKSLRQNMRYFSATDSLLTYPALGQLFTKMEVGVECAPRVDHLIINSAEEGDVSADVFLPESKPVLDIPSFVDFSNAWENSPGLNVSESSEENTLACDGVSLQNTFTAISALQDYENTVFVGAAPAVKHVVSLRNDTSEAQTRRVGWRMILSGGRVDSEKETLSPSSAYELISPTKKYLDDSNSTIAQVEDAVLRFSPSKNEPYFGSYNFSDLVYTGFDPRVLVHKLNGVTVVDTILSVTLAPFEQLDLDPTVVLNSSSNYSAMYAGASNSDFLGRTFARSLTVIGDSNYDQNVPLYNAVQILNMDNDAYANDLFIPAALADINSKTNAGALYIIQDADTKFGDKYVVNSNNYTYRFSGGMANDLLTFPGQPTPGYYLKDTDGNGYTNDLVIIASRADYSARDGGSMYYIKDIDTKAAGNYDLNNSNFYFARYDGWHANDFLGDSYDSGEAIQVGDFDNNGVTNDLVISVPRSNTTGGRENGQISLYKDFNKFSGTRVVNQSTPSWYLYGSASNNDDYLGGQLLGVPGFYVLDMDGNGFRNDLVVVAPMGVYDDCDQEAFPNWGAVYVVKDIHRKSTANNVYSFCTPAGSTSYNYYFYYNVYAMAYGRTGDINSIQFWDLNGDGVYADTVFISPTYTNTQGAILIQKELFKSTTTAFTTGTTILFYGRNANENLGLTNRSGPAVQLVNADGNAFANDMLVNCPFCDMFNSITFGTRTNSGNIIIKHDINRINTAQSFDTGIGGTAGLVLYGSRYVGSSANDRIGDVNGSGDGVLLKDLDGDGKTLDLFISGSSIDTYATDTGAVYWIQDVNDFTGGLNGTGSGRYLYDFDLNKDANYTARWSTPTAYDRLGDTNRSHDSAPKVVNIDNGSASNDLIMLGSFVDVNGKTDAGALYIVKNANTKSGNQDLSNSANYSVMFNGAASNEYLGWNVYGGKGYQIVNIDGNAYANDLLISAARVSDNGTFAGALYVITDADTKSGALDLNNSDNYYKKYVGGAANDFLTSTLHSGEGAQLVNLDNNASANDLLLVSVQADANSVTDAGAVYWLQDIYTLSGGGGPPANDYSFVVSLPSSGCTSGKGRVSAGNGACEKGYFIPTDLSGLSDENQVNPEGQSQSQPFFVYDNQSTSSSDLNILFDLNGSLPAAIQVKVSKTYFGYAGSCTGNTDTNCLLVSTTATNIGKATYSAGTQDLNIFIWTDFVSADVAQYDRNVDSNSIAST